ncbi:enoyl-CoA hydratase/isomerase family protein [Noviherbaspirillum saxi]|uniref:Enoyl-CoA hydratase/isomerase family protein n=1 Tax=Noviherbaspirillum saxi TaxID=2320863 RepID=A0A3A3FIX8_9BURK|nr:enoyl-CoA hydratase/isomerase family protein [Noviherbaspirillum saxi]RJF92494.1 enoyl-CoA hydratase/isomerase family protein [Noviherbaspirillum saxi]
MSTIQYEVNEGVAEILFNNPPVNALSEEMLDEYLSLLRRASTDAAVRAVIVGSAVPGRFCAGLNLQAIHRGELGKVRALLDRLYIQMTETQFSLGKPSIAAIDGTARGGGMTLAISCDMIVASESATFGYPEIDAGVLPSIHFTHLPRIAGRHRAFELLFSGRSFDTAEAVSLGLVSRVTPPGEVLATARDLARSIAGKSAEVIRIGRAAFMSANDNGYRQAVVAAADSFCNVAATADAREGIAAFVEKRKPVWGR